MPYTISDRETFDNATAAPRDLAALYAWAELDCLIELAHSISIDFFERPEFYKRFDDPRTAELLAQLNARYGCTEFFLSDQHRHAIYKPLFDDSAGDFVRDRDALLSAAATFSEWGQSTGQSMLREAVRTTHQAFLGQLTLFNGASVTWSRQKPLPVLTNDICYPILRDSGITAVFGVVKPPGVNWPYIEDANGDQLVEEIARRLDPDREPAIRRHGFRLKQRTALRGAEAIAQIIDFQPPGDDSTLDELITRCYTWYAALQGTTGMGRVASLWTNGSADEDRRALGAGSFLPAGGQ